MAETDGRLAPVTYLPGVVPSVSAHGATPLSSPADAATPLSSPIAADDEWNDTWGGDVPETSVGEVVDVAQEAQAQKVSLGALTRRGLSQRELERVLRDRGIDDETIAEELDRLVRVGLVDDLALAQTLVGTLQERKGLGRTAIAAELTRRLLAPSAIEYALELVDSGDELARANELARKRAAQLGGIDRDAAVRRLSAYLARRGYSGSTVRAAVEQALPLGRHRTGSASGSTVRFR